MYRVSIVDRKKEDGRAYYAFVGFAIGYGARTGIQYTTGWCLEGLGLGRFVG